MIHTLVAACREIRVLIYLAHPRELTEGSAKMSISTVLLYTPAVGR